MKKFYSFAILTTLGLMLTFSASATTQTFNFGGKLSGDNAAPTNLGFASLSFDDVLKKFSLNFSDPSFGANAYLDMVAVDYNFAKKDGNIKVDDVTGGVNKINFNKGNTPNSFYDFVFKIGSGGSDNSKNRLSNGESVSWKSNNFDINKLGKDSNSPFAVHVTNINPQDSFRRGSFGGQFEDDDDDFGFTSAWYSMSPVPEPETYAMMLAGLGVMGFVAKRRRRTN